MERQRTVSGRPDRYLNCVLTVIAVLLGVIALNGAGVHNGDDHAAYAAGQGRTGSSLGVPNAADQRKRIAESVDALGVRLRQIESKIAKGSFDVRVVSMPKVEIAE